jgi:hypothetical protein
MADDSPAVVHLVTSGEYSDYRVDAVYLDRDLAERAVALYAPGDDAQVKTMPVQIGLPVKAARILHFYRKTSDTVDAHEHPSRPVWSDERREVDVHEDDGVIMVEGYDQVRVAKVLEERAARWKAEQAGIT